MNTSNTFCIMPWTGIATTPTGGYKPCCLMSGFDIFYGTLNDYEKSEYLKNIKKDFLENRYPNVCNKCEWNDKQGLISKRVRENQKFFSKHQTDINLDNVDYTVIDLRLNNKCNLKCVTCGPRNSSSIAEEVKNNKDLMEHWKLTLLNIKDMDYYSDQEIDELINRINEKSRVYFTGGEPSLVKPAFYILEKLLEKNVNQNIYLEFNSNFQLLNKKWIKQLKHFKGLMMPSIDAINDKAEFIRYGCVWKDVDYNIRYFLKECTNFKVNIWPTISILNIFYIKDILEWVKTLESTNVSVNLSNRLQEPSYLDIKNLPDSLKEKAYEYLGEDVLFKDIVNHMKNSSSIVEQKKFLIYMDKLDKVRNTNWRKALNEIAYGWE